MVSTSYVTDGGGGGGSSRCDYRYLYHFRKSLVGFKKIIQIDKREGNKCKHVTLLSALPDSAGSANLFCKDIVEKVGAD